MKIFLWKQQFPIRKYSVIGTSVLEFEKTAKKDEVKYLPKIKICPNFYIFYKIKCLYIIYSIVPPVQDASTVREPYT